ncbi:MAG: TauD/TfdA family dioxygenase [Alphaproteobacteria bacterium]
MIQLNIETLHHDFGARLTGTDLSDADIAQVRAAIDTYSVVCFADQDMTDDKQIAFTCRLGKPEAEHVTFGSTGEIKYFGTVGNVDDDGAKRGNADAGTRYQTGNNLWHSDSSFRETPSYVSIVHAYEVPGEDGATEFVSMRAGYERLSEEKRQAIEPLHVLHDYVFSRSRVAPVNPNHAASLPPVMHRLVRQNPANRRRNYFIGSHARSIPGWSGVDGRRLLDDLLTQATEPDAIYAHQWQAGDTVIWDNRCILHRGTGYDADRWRRRMRQTRVVGAEKGVIPGVASSR